jgi:hypothetical protein
MAAPPLPRGARRLFPHHRPEELTPESAAGLLLPRLLEDGDAADLAWTVAAFGEERLAAWLAARGARQLSARSRAFWGLVLAAGGASSDLVAAGPPASSAAGLWSL